MKESETITATDDLVKSFGNRRHRLGWSQKILAEKAGVPLSALRRIESGIGDWPDYLIAIDSTLDTNLRSLTDLEQQKAIDASPTFKSNSYAPEEKVSPYIKEGNKKWANAFDKCSECGKSDNPHLARGLCTKCYDKLSESKQKNINRVRKYGASHAILSEAYLLEQYHENKKSLGDIAKESNCSRQYVYKQMKLYGIPLRGKSAARIIALAGNKIIRENVSQKGQGQFIPLKNVTVNENMFSAWSAEMAYVLGVIYTDGNLLYGLANPRQSQPAGILSISQKQPELLEKVLDLMSCNARLLFTEKRQYGNIVAGELFHLRIRNDKIYNDLVRLGLTPKKSLTLKFPEIPKEYVRHFIRGCWDGDGSVYIDKHSNRITASYVSGSLNFIQGMVSELRNSNLHVKTIYSNKRKPPSYYFRLTGKQVPIFYHFLYDDISPTQYLERKFNLFCRSLEMNPQ